MFLSLWHLFGSISLALIVTTHAWTQANREPIYFSTEELKIFILHSPAALLSTEHGGCPVASFETSRERVLLVQVRNNCPKRGSGMLANYWVDQLSLRLWKDADTKVELDTRELRRIRNRLMETRRKRE